MSPLARLAETLLGAGAIIPPGPPPATQPDGVARFTLPTGLHLVVVERPGVQLVALDLRVRFGSGDETVETSGLAHAVEHLLFKGAATRGVGDLDAVFEGLGGELSARTSRDATQFSLVIPAPGWRSALATLVEMVRQPALRPEDWKAEQPVIFSEMALARADVDRAGVAELARALYAPGEPYGLPLLGLRENVARFTAADLREFWRAIYRPTRMTLVVVGDVTVGAVRDAALRAFAGPSAVPDQRPLRRASVRDEAVRMVPPSARPDRELATLILGWPTPPVADAAATSALAALTQLLGRADRGELAGPLVRESRHALSVDVEHLLQRAGGLFTIRLTVPVAEVAKAEGDVRVLLRRLGEDGFSLEDVETARRRMLAQQASEEASVESLARRLGLFAGMEAPTLAEELKKRTAAITSDDVLMALRRYLRLDRGAVVTLAAEEDAGGRRR